jgi:hypothetical protein
MAQPEWMRVIFWSEPLTIAKLNSDRSVIPAEGGFYVFTDYYGPLIVNQVLYVGETKSLSGRLPAYLVHDPTRSGNRHKGAQFIGDHRTRLSNDQSIYLRWSLFDSGRALRRDIEAAMIQFYNPDYNDRDWDRPHPFV